MDTNQQQQNQQPQAAPAAQQPQQPVPVPYQGPEYPPQPQQNAPASYPPAAPTEAMLAAETPRPAAQGPSAASDATPAPAEPKKDKEFDIKTFHKYITRQVALAIAGIMLLFSVIGIAVTINDISSVSNAIDSIFPFRSGIDDRFDRVTSSLRTELEMLRIYLFVYLATCIAQAAVSGAGLLAILKNLPATHKLYMFGTAGLVVVRIVLLFLIRVNGFSVFTMLLNAAILYAIWVYQGKIEGAVATETKETELT